KVVRLSADDLRQTVGTMLSEHGNVHVQSDGLVMVGDRVEVLEKINEMLDRVESAPVDVWAVQFFVVSINDTDASQVGVDIDQAVDVAATFAAASSGAASAGADVRGSLSAALRLAITRDRSRTITTPMFVMTD